MYLFVLPCANVNGKKIVKYRIIIGPRGLKTLVIYYGCFKRSDSHGQLHR